VSAQTTTIRANIISGLQSITGLTGVPVLEAADVNDVLEVAFQKPAVVVVDLGLNATKQQMMGGGLRKTYAELSYALVIVAESYRSPGDVQSQVGGLDDLREAVRGIRDIPVGAASNPNTYLILDSEVLVDPKDNPAQGGCVMFVCSYHSTSVLV